MASRKENPTYEAETGGIRIRVKPRFLSEESEPVRNHFVWAYTVEIENTSEETWQLMVRHWQIVDSQGRSQTVDGDGVIGQQPVLAPGDAFKYTSGAPLAAPSGFMSGSYDFQSRRGTWLTAEVPAFSLDSPFERSRPS
ncbi:MAG: Co2+/Mg2+ efflux protein ApaG [Pseudomonadota bacterium]